jgi:hypothetical protein
MENNDEKQVNPRALFAATPVFKQYARFQAVFTCVDFVTYAWASMKTCARIPRRFKKASQVLENNIKNCTYAMKPNKLL